MPGGWQACCHSGVEVQRRHRETSGWGGGEGGKEIERDVEHCLTYCLIHNLSYGREESTVPFFLFGSRKKTSDMLNS